jgi:hypothetical protein
MRPKKRKRVNSQTHEKRFKFHRHPGRGSCPLCHYTGRKARLGDRAYRTASLKQGRYEDITGIHPGGDYYTFTHTWFALYHGPKEPKGNLHNNGTRRNEAYRALARQKRFYSNL